MKQNIIITIILVLAAFTLLILLIHPEWIEQAWLWGLGLAGSATALFRRFFAKFTEAKLPEIKKSNTTIKDQLSELERKIIETNERRELEKKLYEKDLELLTQKIQLKESEVAWEKEKRRRLENMHWEEYYYSMSDEQRREVQERQNSNTLDLF